MSDVIRTSLGPVSLAVAALALTAVAAGVARAGEAAPDASWRCIAGICVGQSRTALADRYGGSARSDIPSRTLRVKGGRVGACFWRCFNAVTEDGFTYYGGVTRPADRVLTVSTCGPVFRLPDGVTLGTAIPFGQRWHGYRRMTRYLEGGGFGWERVVRQSGVSTKVMLTMNRGRVQCLYLEQPR